MMETREKKIYRVTIGGTIANTLLLILKFLAGIFGHSAAMIADAVHSLSDFLTDLVVLIFVKISNKPADRDYAYGHGKYETVASSVIGMALIVVAVSLALDGVEKIIFVLKGGTLDSPGWIAFAAAVLSIVVKEIVYRVTKKVAVEVHSGALEANAWHHRSDALSSVGTAIGIGAAVFFGSKWTVLDPVAAVVVSVMILVAAAKIIGKSFGELLEKSLPKETVDKIVAIVSRDSMVEDIHNIYTRNIGNKMAIEMHLRLPGDISLSEAHRHASAIERDLRAELGDNTHIMLHLEPCKRSQNPREAACEDILPREEAPAYEEAPAREDTLTREEATACKDNPQS